MKKMKMNELVIKIIENLLYQQPLDPNINQQSFEII